jgi:hypothetical protein
MLRQQPEFEWLCLTQPKVLIDTRRMAETIEVGPNLSFTVENVSHGVSLVVRERNAQLGWVLSPKTASQLAEAITDALTIGKLKTRGSS